MSKKKENDYVFPKEIRDLFNKILKENPEIENMSRYDPDFFNILFRGCGLENEEIRKMWNSIGRPDLEEEIID